MRQASDELKKSMEDGLARFYQEARIVFSDGSTKDLGKKDFYLSGNGFSDGAGTNAFALGEAMAKSINAILVNDKDQLSEYDFYHARITVWCCCDLKENKERLKIGTFTIGTPSAKEGEIEITGTDDMYKGDTDYDTSLTFPATAKQILIDSCIKCGITLKKESFANDNFLVLKKPTQCTHRSVWGMVAMLAGGNARMDQENRLEIISYDLSFFSRKGLDGGIFDNGDHLYQTGDVADGGNFLDYSSGDSYDGGGFEELGRYHMFYQSQTPTIDTDDILITGVQSSSGDSFWLYGTEGYVLSVENQLIAGKVREGVDVIGRMVTGMRFRPFTVDHTSYPLAEFGDICYVFDRKGNFYQSVITDLNFSFYGYTTIKCSADSVLRNSSEYKPAAAEIIADVEKQTDEKFDQIIEETDQKFDEVSQNIGEVNENIGELHVSLEKTNEGLNAEVSRALSAEEKISSRITLTEKSIDLEVRRAIDAENYLSGRISITESNIDIEVRRAQGVENDLYSRISLTESSITAEVSRATQAEGNLSARLSITDSQISTKVSAGEVSSLIEQKADSIRLKGGAIIIDSTYFSVTSSGYATMSGGKIGSFTLTNYGSLQGSGIEISGSQLYCNSISSYTGNIVNIDSGMTINGNVYLPNVYGNTISGDANLGITGTGYVGRTGGSSKKWKDDVTNIIDEEIDAHRLYNVRPRQFRYKDDYLSKKDCRYKKLIPGFIIEELEEDYPIAVDYDSNGDPENWSARPLIPPIVLLLQEHKEEIEKIKSEINKLMEMAGGI